MFEKNLHLSASVCLFRDIEGSTGGSARLVEEGGDEERERDLRIAPAEEQ
jgi:hypothetical protein